MDFSPSGELIATLTCTEICLVTDVNTNNCSAYQDLKHEGNLYALDKLYSLSLLFFYPNRYSFQLEQLF